MGILLPRVWRTEFLTKNVEELCGKFDGNVPIVFGVRHSSRFLFASHRRSFLYDSWSDDLSKWKGLEYLWWACSKFDPVNSPMIFFEKGKPIIHPVNPEIGIDMALKHMIRYVDKYTISDTMKFFCMQSPRHFEGGEWDQGGSCRRLQPLLPGQVKELFSLENNGTNVEVRLINKHLHKALEGSSFHILDIAHLSEFRADAHPSPLAVKSMKIACIGAYQD